MLQPSQPAPYPKHSFLAPAGVSGCTWTRVVAGGSSPADSRRRAQSAPAAVPGATRRRRRRKEERLGRRCWQRRSRRLARGGQRRRSSRLCRECAVLRLRTLDCQLARWRQARSLGRGAVDAPAVGHQSSAGSRHRSRRAGGRVGEWSTREARCGGGKSRDAGCGLWGRDSRGTAVQRGTMPDAAQDDQLACTVCTAPRARAERSSTGRGRRRTQP